MNVDTLLENSFNAAVHRSPLQNAPFRFYTWNIPEPLIEEVRQLAKKRRHAQAWFWSGLLFGRSGMLLDELSPGLRGFCRGILNQTSVIGDTLSGEDLHLPLILIPFAEKKTTVNRVTLGVAWEPATVKKMALWYGKRCNEVLQKARE